MAGGGDRAAQAPSFPAVVGKGGKLPFEVRVGGVVGGGVADAQVEQRGVGVQVAEDLPHPGGPHRRGKGSGACAMAAVAGGDQRRGAKGWVAAAAQVEVAVQHAVAQPAGGVNGRFKPRCFAKQVEGGGGGVKLLDRGRRPPPAASDGKPQPAPAQLDNR